MFDFRGAKNGAWLEHTRALELFVLECNSQTISTKAITARWRELISRADVASLPDDWLRMGFMCSSSGKKNPVQMQQVLRPSLTELSFPGLSPQVASF